MTASTIVILLILITFFEIIGLYFFMQSKFQNCYICLGCAFLLTAVMMLASGIF